MIEEQDHISLYKKERAKLLDKIDEIKYQIIDYEKKVKAFEILIGDDNLSKLEDTYRGIDVYPIEGSYVDKLKFILAWSRTATAKYIAEEIVRQENISDDKEKDKILKNITLHASRLYSIGELEVEEEKEGKAYIYKFKK